MMSMLSSLISFRTRVAMSHQPRAGISCGRSAVRPRSAVSLLIPTLEFLYRCPAQDQNAFRVCLFQAVSECAKMRRSDDGSGAEAQEHEEGSLPPRLRSSPCVGDVALCLAGL